MLETVNEFIVYQILDYLPVSSLVQLSSTCRSLRSVTTSFVNHKIKRQDCADDVANFSKLNSEFLLLNEKELLEYCTSPSGGPDPYCNALAFLRLSQILPGGSGYVRRTSFLHARLFSYLGDRTHVDVLQCQQLNRKMAYLKNISWLVVSVNVCKKLPHPANYTIRMRLKIHESVRWLGTTPMVLTLNISSHHTRKESRALASTRDYFVHPSVWSTLYRDGKADLAYNDYNDPYSFTAIPDSSQADSDGAWFFIVFDDIGLLEGSTVDLTVDDRSNIFFKSGITLDYVEIYKKNLLPESCTF